MEHMEHIALGADIGGGHIQVAAVDMATGRLIEASAVYRKVNSKGTADEILDCWAGALKESLQLIDYSGLSGIGFAMPGPFNYRTGVALFEKTDKYESLYGMDITSALAVRLDVPLEARYINDAAAFAVGEAWAGKSADSHRSMAITLGTGMGSAYVQNGLPLTDHPEVAAHGCLWHIPYREGIADDYFSTRWFIRMYADQTGISVKGVKEIADRGDNISRQLFERFGHNLGAFLKPWVGRFRPEVLVFAGSISNAIHSFLPAFKEMLHPHDRSIAIERSELNEKAAILGSARLFDPVFWERVKGYLPVR